MRSVQHALAKLRPADDIGGHELAKLQRLRENGKTPGNPKWYSVPRIKPFEFEAGLPAVVPAWTRSTSMPAQSFKFPVYEDGMDLAEYLKEFDKENGLKPHPVEWIKVVDGNYA